LRAASQVGCVVHRITVVDSITIALVSVANTIVVSIVVDARGVARSKQYQAKKSKDNHFSYTRKPVALMWNWDLCAPHVFLPAGKSG